MKSARDVEVLSARAAISAYIALAGFWIVLALVFVALAVAERAHGMVSGAAIALAVGLAWIVWLRGFRLEIGNGKIEYRDGFYKSVIVALSEVRETKNAWVEWKLPGRHLRVPRLVIVYGPRAERLAVNAKPFARQDIQRALTLLRN